MAHDKKALNDFVERWRGKGYEKGETHQFWLQILSVIGYPRANDVDNVIFERHLPSGGFIDVWIRDAGVLVEQKSNVVDLDKQEQRQGKLKTPLEQALDYAEELPFAEQPRYIVTCNFGRFRVYDRAAWGKSQLANHPFEFTLEEFGAHPEYLGFINDPTNSRLEKEKIVSIKAGELVGKLYDRMRAGYLDPDSETSMHALNVLCVRLVFCLYCEDADIFPKDAFYNYLKEVPAKYVRDALKRLFRALDTEIKDRDPYDVEFKVFPYVNGGLFRGEREVPNFTEDMKRFLLEEVSKPVDWSQISPTIFGGIFESTLNPETRRSGGMHYTSPENIHKVIDPLFLDGLKAEFIAIRDKEGATPRERKSALLRFHQKICGLKFFDPACGSGNFLTETYICLRKLEDAVLRELWQGQTSMGFENEEAKGERVSLNQFYGIEINDFAVTVAETALWISRLKANGETAMFLDLSADDLPLRESAHIVHANALRIDWNDVLPANECSYIMGNPPFYGGKLLGDEQRKDIRNLFGSIKLVNSIDYVSGWYMKACDYMSAVTSIRAAFVSTNSITQGEQVYPVWNTLKTKFPIHINFAWRTFIWDSEASDKAHVHVVIIGFSVNEEEKTKFLFDGEKVHKAVRINPYLVDGPDAIIEASASSISAPVNCMYGSLVNDKGYYIFTDAEKLDFITKEPLSERYFRPYVGATEFINGGWRNILYLKGISDVEIDTMPCVRERVEAVRNFRKASSASATIKSAERPTTFFYDSTCEGHYLLIPRTSSERRFYLPIGFMPSQVVASDATAIVANASLYHFGIATSLFHNAWMRTVGGRLKSDYRYAPKTVWNTFPWPSPTTTQCRLIEECAQAVLDARANHEGRTLAEMYDGISPMPENPSKSDLKKFDRREYDDLRAAHKALDAAVEAAYGVDFGGDEEKIVAHLFKLYAEKTVSRVL